MFLQSNSLNNLVDKAAVWINQAFSSKAKKDVTLNLTGCQ